MLVELSFKERVFGRDGLLLLVVEMSIRSLWSSHQITAWELKARMRGYPEGGPQTGRGAKTREKCQTREGAVNPSIYNPLKMNTVIPPNTRILGLRK